MSSGFKDILQTFAPVIGTALGGPLGGAAARFAVEKLTGEKIETEQGNVDRLKAFLGGASPADMAMLKKLDQEFELQLKELDIKKEALNVDDRKSARNMAMAAGMRPQIILSAIYTTAYAMVMFCFMAGWINVPENQQILFGSLIGILTGAQVQIMNFWFGSSSGSKEKDALK